MSLASEHSLKKKKETCNEITATINVRQQSMNLDLKLNYRTEIDMSINSGRFTQTKWRTKIQQKEFFCL
jgi:hypothetical protein